MGNMDRQNCSSDYYYHYDAIDSSKFGQPVRWIGLYVALASLLCLLLMTTDLLHSSRWKKGRIPSKFFAFNAATLTLLALATKLPSNVTGAMPGLIDQLAKLCGIIILCMAMNHAMPSLGAMDGLTITSNMIALGIMVVSMSVNIWLQLRTGLIDYHFFRSVYVPSSTYMWLLLLFLLSHSLTVPASRRILKRQYSSIHKKILSEISGVDARARFSDGKLEEYISKYWLMALTSSPHYTLHTSGLSPISDFLNIYLSFISFAVFFIIYFKYIRLGVRLSCLARSDYSWSTLAILLVQVLAIAIEGVSSSLRLGYSFYILQAFSTTRRNLFKNEKYRYELLKEWNDIPLPVCISNKRFRQGMRFLREMFLGILIILQFLVITLRRIILLVVPFILLVLQFLLPKLFNRNRDGKTNASSDVDMSRYVLYLEDEEDSEQSKKIAESWQNYPKRWIDLGGATQPTNLGHLLRSNSLPEAFGAVRKFYSIQIPPVGSSRELINCWALPIVTLASIIYATSPHREHFMIAVSESLRYIRLVDKNLDERGTRRMQKAAEIAWEKLYLQNRWLNVDLKQTSSTNLSDLIIHLRREAQKDTRQDCNHDEYWPMTVFIANCMYTTTEIILDLPCSVERLEKVMVGLLGACLTNLPLAIFKHCSSGTFGLREEKVREAAIILGETQEILKLLEDTDLVANYPEGPEQKEYFESWCGRSPSPQSCASSPVSQKVWLDDLISKLSVIL